MWDATTFFTDMHHILRITSLGPVRTLSFYRLKLLEQVSEKSTALKPHHPASYQPWTHAQQERCACTSGIGKGKSEP